MEGRLSPPPRLYSRKGDVVGGTHTNELQKLSAPADGVLSGPG